MLHTTPCAHTHSLRECLTHTCAYTHTTETVPSTHEMCIMLRTASDLISIWLQQTQGQNRLNNTIGVQLGEKDCGNPQEKCHGFSNCNTYMKGGMGQGQGSGGRASTKLAWGPKFDFQPHTWMLVWGWHPQTPALLGSQSATGNGPHEQCRGQPQTSCDNKFKWRFFKVGLKLQATQGLGCPGSGQCICAQITCPGKEQNFQEWSLPHITANLQW